ncbi:hypothetical protein DNTS_014730 [Danionella cerebrum]|uniref:Uncharacterized protein n=1 Tax=Danionella cerebrum TaxID=2873325 RepID=A0A553PMT2_9TELE|nr:hypothetical protein DNTS_014730 [Danionella translucida]
MCLSPEQAPKASVRHVLECVWDKESLGCCEVLIAAAVVLPVCAAVGVGLFVWKKRGQRRDYNVALSKSTSSDPEN